MHAQKLRNLADDFLHAGILRDNVHDAQADLEPQASSGDWAAGPGITK